MAFCKILVLGVRNIKGIVCEIVFWKDTFNQRFSRKKNKNIPFGERKYIGKWYFYTCFVW